MNKNELIKEVAQLKANYHCRKLNVEIMDCFTVADGAVNLNSFEAIVYVDDDMLMIGNEAIESYDGFINELREAISKRQRNVFNKWWYEKIAGDVIDWEGSKQEFWYEENGLTINIEYNRSGHWWESFVTNEDDDEVDTNFDMCQFEHILENMRDKIKEANLIRFQTEQHLRKTA